MEVYLQAFLDWAPDGGAWLASRPCRLLLPLKLSTVPTENEAQWASEPAQTLL